MIRKGMYLQGRYGLTERLAVGGMGEVWSANDDLMGRTVAIKILRPSLSAEHTFQARFREEARTAGSLSHAGIAAVFDYGETDGLYYLVMEMVDGEPLSAHISRSAPMPIDLVLSLISQTARGLHAAHVAGVIHRDVKPANLMVTPALSVKITDFGIARPQDHEPLTATGQVMGTAHYLAPELARGQVATSRSDLYALGIVMYECLAGRRPFEGTNQVAVATAQLTDQPPPLPEAIPSSIRRIVEQVLSKDPAGRPGSASDFADQLDRLAEGKAYSHRNTPSSGTRAQQPVSPSQGATAMMYDPIPPAGGASGASGASGATNYAAGSAATAAPNSGYSAAEKPVAPYPYLEGSQAAATTTAPPYPPQYAQPYPPQYPAAPAAAYPANYSITPGMYPQGGTFGDPALSAPPAEHLFPAQGDISDLGMPLTPYEPQTGTSVVPIAVALVAAVSLLVLAALFLFGTEKSRDSSPASSNGAMGGSNSVLDGNEPPAPANTLDPDGTQSPSDAEELPGDTTVPPVDEGPDLPPAPDEPVTGDDPPAPDPGDDGGEDEGGGGANIDSADTVTVIEADYVGKNRKWAINRLQDMGLIVEEKLATSPTPDDEGKVLSVTPNGDLEIGDTVVLTVGKRNGGG